MGFAKYNEDNIEIVEDRLWNKQHKSYYEKVEEKLRKKKVEYRQERDNSQTLQRAFEELRQHISNLKVWIQFYQAILKDIETVDLKNYIKYRCEDLEFNLDRYYNDYFSKTYKELREKETTSLKVEDEWLTMIRKDFLQTFINYLKGLSNRNQKESMVIRVLYEDLNIYMEKYFSEYQAAVKKKGIVKTIMEDILDEQEMVYICPCCQRETYESFKICLNCNRGREDR